MIVYQVIDVNTGHVVESCDTESKAWLMVHELASRDALALTRDDGFVQSDWFEASEHYIVRKDTINTG